MAEAGHTKSGRRTDLAVQDERQGETSDVSKRSEGSNETDPIHLGLPSYRPETDATSRTTALATASSATDQGQHDVGKRWLPWRVPKGTQGGRTCLRHDSLQCCSSCRPWLLGQTQSVPRVAVSPI